MFGYWDANVNYTYQAVQMYCCTERIVIKSNQKDYYKVSKAIIEQSSNNVQPLTHF